MNGDLEFHLAVIDASFGALGADYGELDRDDDARREHLERIWDS